MMELVEAFDKLDENLDTKVTLDEFLKYQVRNYFRGCKFFTFFAQNVLFIVFITTQSII